ncbi:fumarylacetoacetate hydrolase family protein [candidate division KSB1 bacterium]|nr:fumarylacetoacetate hydrolase family protein [candidate division KSB1 bacterium]NIR71191.1 fumarylacetoacetate hydrolase family protein [candidate division KSB1 bacterium]NIS26176.1 fumarylacetoacetate hydrolase family protein [candidate division KSB1 bacterium]NIT72941.1 fumarylacetoacetate hydrolase family protein [candidate division KSB1 bacterium]NIU26823.1 fumarylacetoacetate hydrolase family protein [candidate division KSB1 bacterium]
MVEADFFHLETFQEVLETLQKIRPISHLKLRDPITYLPPVGRPQKVLCVGRNYQAHAEELGNTVPDEPVFFSKAPSALIAHQEKINLPKEVGRVDFEGELAIVIRKQAHNVSAKNAFEYIAGYSILNDVTARDLQRADIEAGRPWFRSKSFDTFCPFGPFLVPGEAIKNYRNLELEVKVNDERKQHTSLSQMIFGIEEIVAYISKHCTLQPGDVIATGTPSGVDQLNSGDVVKCHLSEIGVLRNPVGQ